MPSTEKPPDRPWARVSIRVMMVVVLVVAIVLGWQVNRVREQQEAVRGVQRYGGWVHYDHEFVGGMPAPGRSPVNVGIAR
jgi:hypothetical protein